MTCLEYVPSILGSTPTQLSHEVGTYVALGTLTGWDGLGASSKTLYSQGGAPYQHHVCIECPPHIGTVYRYQVLKYIVYPCTPRIHHLQIDQIDDDLDHVDHFDYLNCRCERVSRILIVQVQPRKHVADIMQITRALPPTCARS